jgi:formylglycine-generating enzyme required for sulfatase activity
MPRTESISFEVPTVDDHGRTVARAPYSAQQVTFELGSVTLAAVRVPAGEFLMGSAWRMGYPDERPQHRVNCPAFLMGKHAVTQEQWAAVMDWSPPYRCVGAKLPVDRVSWPAARAFCQALSAKIGRQVALPSEAQWEYACRAGTTTPFCYGPTLTTQLANYVGAHTYAWEPQGEYRHMTTEAGAFPPNAFGLHEMHGNVWEWCADAWHESYDGAPADGGAWLTGGDGACRVLRGGGWHDPPDLCRSAARLRFRAEEGEDWTGFRVVIT